MYTTAFLIFLGATVVAIVLTVLAGLRKRRRAHLVRAITTVVLLAITIYFAYQMDTERVFPVEEMKIHRIFSRSIACIVPLLVFTGAMLWRRPGWRPAHRLFIVLFLVDALCAAVTGIWVLYLSVPR